MFWQNQLGSILFRNYGWTGRITLCLGPNPGLSSKMILYCTSRRGMTSTSLNGMQRGDSKKSWRLNSNGCQTTVAMSEIPTWATSQYQGWSLARTQLYQMSAMPFTLVLNKQRMFYLGASPIPRWLCPMYCGGRSQICFHDRWEEAGPDGVPGHGLRLSTNQQAIVFASNHKLSLQWSSFPSNSRKSPLLQSPQKIQ